MFGEKEVLNINQHVYVFQNCFESRKSSAFIYIYVIDTFYNIKFILIRIYTKNSQVTNICFWRQFIMQMILVVLFICASFYKVTQKNYFRMKHTSKFPP